MKQAQSCRLRPFVYLDSSEEEPEYQPCQHSPKVLRECNSDFRAPPSDYQQQIRRIVENQIDKIQHGDQLLVEVNDRDIQQALLRRKDKYQYFLQQMAIDSKYNAIIGHKVSKLQADNLRKEQVLKKKRRQEQCQQEEEQLRKFLIEKQDKEQQVLRGVKNMAHKLGVERNAHLSKKVKTQVEAQRTATGHQLTNLRIKQKNQLEELRGRYEEIKEAERVNRLEQGKVLKDLQSKNKALKSQVETKLLIKKDFII